MSFIYSFEIRRSLFALGTLSALRTLPGSALAKLSLRENKLLVRCKINVARYFGEAPLRSCKVLIASHNLCSCVFAAWKDMDISASRMGVEDLPSPLLVVLYNSDIFRRDTSPLMIR